MRVVVCGGGIIGASVAYHLAKKGVTCTVIERCKPACAASGKAGGFLARDWCDSYELGPITTASFDMHMALSEDEHFQDCDYRRVDTLGLKVQADEALRVGALPEWLNGGIVKSSNMGSTETTAQVHPRKLTEAFLRNAKRLANTEVMTGVVEGVEQTGDGKVTGVCVKDHGVIAADAVVITLGPWSSQAKDWLGLARVKNHRAHSIIIEPKDTVTAQAIFMEYGTRATLQMSPEVYPRPDGTVYVCGMDDNEALPDDPAEIKPNINSCRTLKTVSNALSASLRDGEVLIEQVCHLPTSCDGLPIIGALPRHQGAYVATAHSCWGILNAPATGEVLAQLIVDGKCSLLDITPFSPARFK